VEKKRDIHISVVICLLEGFVFFFHIWRKGRGFLAYYSPENIGREEGKGVWFLFVKCQRIGN